MTRVIYLSFLVFCTLPLFARADDTSIFISNRPGSTDPRVLLSIDTSNLYNPNTGNFESPTLTAHTPYDPSISYPGAFSSSRVYFTFTGYSLPSTESAAYNAIRDYYFPRSISRCYSANFALDNAGYYDVADRFAAYRAFGALPVSWYPLDNSNDTKSATHIDCQADTNFTHLSNAPAGSGYPSSSNPPYSLTYTDGISMDFNSMALYAGNYLNWYFNAAKTQQSLPEILKWIGQSIALANPDTPFGLIAPIRFNGSGVCGLTTNAYTTCTSGAQIKKHMFRRSFSFVPDVANSIGALQSTTYFPADAQLFEAMRYLRGEGVGNGTFVTGTDPSALSTASDYRAPTAYNVCPMSNIHIINLIHSLPSEDAKGRADLSAYLPEEYRTPTNYSNPSPLPPYYPSATYADTQSFLPEAARYIKNTDNHFLHYVSLANPDTANLFGNNVDPAGKTLWTYSNFNDPTKMISYIQSLIRATYTSQLRSVVAPAFLTHFNSKTRSGDTLYIPTFEPAGAPFWKGNISAVPVANWSPAALSSPVTTGGFGSVLNSTSRSIYSNYGTGSSGLNLVNESAASSSNELSALFTGAGIEQPNHVKAAKWIHGEGREWLMADPLHFKPQIIDYGPKNNTERRYAIVGTNDGLLHFFDAITGMEKWAFFPKELFPVLPKLMLNINGDSHAYGVDGEPLVYRFDKNQDGKFDASDGDRVLLYFGTRRGGQFSNTDGNLYAMDITDPAKPALLWQINSSTPGFARLAQQWSRPVIGAIPGYYTITNNFKTYKPALVLAGGYDPSTKDSTLIETTPDAKGNALYFLDALTGSVIYTISPDNAANTMTANMQHSFVAEPSAIDVNGDGIFDKIYAADVAGHIWRIDLAKDELPNSTTNGWSVYELANLALPDDYEDDAGFFSIRTFYKLDVVHTPAYDALVFGTGNRPNPNKEYSLLEARNKIFVLKDPTIRAVKHVATNPANDELIFPDTVELGDLYDVTDNAAQVGATQSIRLEAQANINAAKGWYITLPANEKIMGRAYTIKGTIYLNGYTPDHTTGNCPIPTIGFSRVYALDVRYGRAVQSGWDGDLSNLTTADRSKAFAGAAFMDAIAPYFDEDGHIHLLLPSGETIDSLNSLTDMPTTWLKVADE